MVAVFSAHDGGNPDRGRLRGRYGVSCSLHLHASPCDRPPVRTETGGRTRVRRRCTCLHTCATRMCPRGTGGCSHSPQPPPARWRPPRAATTHSGLCSRLRSSPPLVPLCERRGYGVHGIGKPAAADGPAVALSLHSKEAVVVRVMGPIRWMSACGDKRVHRPSPPPPDEAPPRKPLWPSTDTVPAETAAGLVCADCHRHLVEASDLIDALISTQRTGRLCRPRSAPVGEGLEDGRQPAHEPRLAASVPACCHPQVVRLRTTRAQHRRRAPRCRCLRTGGPLVGATTPAHPLAVGQRRLHVCARTRHAHRCEGLLLRPRPPATVQRRYGPSRGRLDRAERGRGLPVQAPRCLAGDPRRPLAPYHNEAQTVRRRKDTDMGASESCIPVDHPGSLTVYLYERTVREGSTEPVWFRYLIATLLPRSGWTVASDAARLLHLPDGSMPAYAAGDRVPSGRKRRPHTHTHPSSLSVGREPWPGTVMRASNRPRASVSCSPSRYRWPRAPGRPRRFPHATPAAWVGFPPPSAPGKRYRVHCVFIRLQREPWVRGIHRPPVAPGENTKVSSSRAPRVRTKGNTSVTPRITRNESLLVPVHAESTSTTVSIRTTDHRRHGQGSYRQLTRARFMTPVLRGGSPGCGCFPLVPPARSTAAHYTLSTRARLRYTDCVIRPSSSLMGWHPMTVSPRPSCDKYIQIFG